MKETRSETITPERSAALIAAYQNALYPNEKITPENVLQAYKGFEEDLLVHALDAELSNPDSEAEQRNALEAGFLGFTVLSAAGAFMAQSQTAINLCVMFSLVCGLGYGATRHTRINVVNAERRTPLNYDINQRLSSILLRPDLDPPNYQSPGNQL